MHTFFEQLSSRRVILVSGKGGVGKTTAATAIACLVRHANKRVLCVEMATDNERTSALARALGGDCPSGDEPTEMQTGIHAVRITPTSGFLRFFEQVLPARWMATAALRSKKIRRFLLSAPAFAETGTLLRLLDLAAATRDDGSPTYEVVVVDLPATGHALALVQLPRILLRTVLAGPLHAAASDGLALLTDPRRCGAVIVTLAEELPVSEAIELAEGLRARDIPLAGILLNRVPPDPFAKDERPQVRQLIERYGPLLGGELVDRIERARAARTRLAATISLPIATVGEQTNSGWSLATALAAECLG